MLGPELRRATGVALVGLAGLTSACATATRPAPAEARRQARLGQPAPALAGALLGGGRFELAAHLGRVVVVDFWATWCEPCAQALPVLSDTATGLSGADLVVVTVSIDEAGADPAAFMRDLGLGLPIVHDPSGELAKAWAPPAMPSTFVVGRDGRIVEIVAGWSKDHPARLRDAIEVALRS